MKAFSSFLREGMARVAIGVVLAFVDHDRELAFVVELVRSGGKDSQI